MKDYSLRDEKSKLIQALATSLHEHITELFDNGYDQGYADATIDLAHEENDRAYQNGLEDAWEAARKLVDMSDKDIEKCFDVVALNTNGFKGILHHISAFGVIEKIKEYEEQQNTIQVGDEVYSEEDDLRFVVTRIYEGRYEGVCTDGAAYCPLPNDIKKTGRHTETILKVLGEFDEKD